MSARDERVHQPAADAPAGSRTRDEPGRSSESPRLEAVVDRVGAIGGRVIRVWRALPSERRLAVFAALGLFGTLFLPWYQETVIARGVTSLRSLSDSLTGWGAFSFVEAAVLLVAGGVLLLLFVRAEGRAFHVPGGDGSVVTAAGAWACVLIIWRMFDKEGTTGHGLYTTTSGIEWGIFVALAVAGLLTYCGTRIRLAHEPEPALPGERPRRRRLTGRGRDQAGRAPSRQRTSAVELQTWAAAEEIEEMWLAQGPATADDTRPLPAADDTRRLPASEDTRRLPPAEDTVPLPSPDPTVALPPADAAPAPRRRRPRSIAEPPRPSPDDQATLPFDRRS